LHGIEHGHANMLAAAFTWRYASDNLRAIVDALLGVKCALATGDALASDLAVPIN